MARGLALDIAVNASSVFLGIRQTATRGLETEAKPRVIIL
jgi:hypothetical protein